MEIVGFVLLGTAPCSLLYLGATTIMLCGHSGNTGVVRLLVLSVVVFLATGLALGSCMFGVAVGEASDFIKDIVVPALAVLLLVIPILSFLFYLIYPHKCVAEPAEANIKQKVATVLKRLGASLMCVSALGFLVQLVVGLW